MKHQLFNQEVAKKIHTGEWGLNEINFLQENKQKYHLTHANISYYLQELYRYTYTLAMQDGLISQSEQHLLSLIRTHLSSPHMPTNRFGLEHLKLRIETAQTHCLKHRPDYQEQFQHKYEHENQMQQEITSTYNNSPTPKYGYARPKLTPYSQYGRY